MTLPICLTFTNTALPPLDTTGQADLLALAAEAMGWQPLDQGVYLHHGDIHGEEKNNWGQIPIAANLGGIASQNGLASRMD